MGEKMKVVKELLAPTVRPSFAAFPASSRVSAGVPARRMRVSSARLHGLRHLHEVHLATFQAFTDSFCFNKNSLKVSLFFYLTFSVPQIVDKRLSFLIL